jgi:putative ABC transport system permease protein
MMLALHDLWRKLPRFIATTMAVALLIGMVMLQATIYRGLVADSLSLVRMLNSDLWVVQSNRFGPFTEVSSVPEDLRDVIRLIPGVRSAEPIVITTALADIGGEMSVAVVGYDIDRMAFPAQLMAGRTISRPRSEVVVDRTLGLGLGQSLKIRGRAFTIVGITDRAVGIAGEPIAFLSLPDARDVASKETPPEIRRDRLHGGSGAVGSSVNAIRVQIAPEADISVVRNEIRTWKHVDVITREEQENDIMYQRIFRVRTTLLLFAVILMFAAAAIIALTIYSLTADKVREIATLKLIGAGDRVIVGMIVWQAILIGLGGCGVGTIIMLLEKRVFPGYAEIHVGDCVIITLISMLSCLAASVIGVRVALKVAPNQALSG